MHSNGRHRSAAASNPFTDPTYLRPPPPPPPKSSKQSKMATAKVAPPSQTNEDVVEAPRDSPRKPTRSQTATTPVRQNPPSRRSHSQDDVIQAANTVEKAKPTKNRSKKSSQHADVIDRLDFSGPGPFVVHHDGPFDACAPSRNRYPTQAPMLAWSLNPDDEAALSSSHDSPYRHTEVFQNTHPSPSYIPPPRKVDAIAEAWGIHEPEPFEEFYAGANDTPTSSIYAGKEGHNKENHKSRNGRRGKDTRYEDVAEPRRTARRALPPPQPIFVQNEDEPIENFAPSASGPKRSKSLMDKIRKMRDAPNVPPDQEVPPSPSSSENVERGLPSPRHRSHHSFLGMFGGRSKDTPATTSAEPPMSNSDQFVFVTKVDKPKDLPITPPDSGNINTFTENMQDGYLEGSPSSPTSSAAHGVPSSSPPSAGLRLGRRASQFKKKLNKVGRVVNRTK